MKQLIFLVFVLALISYAAQEPKRIMKKFSSDNAVIMREVGAVITAKENKIVVENILGNNNQQTADIQKDDEVLMTNGKKIKGINELRDQYDNAKVGDEFKLGLKRGENLLISKFIKKSEDELNKSGGGMVMMRIEKNDGDEVFPALGLVVRTKNTSAVVNDVLPTASGNFKSFEPKKNDIISSVNGTSVKNAKEFQEAYDNLKEGETVTIEFSRNGKQNKVNFPKPKPQRRMIIKQQHQ